MIELRSARDMRVTYMLIIAFQQNAFGIAVSPDPSSLSTWKGRDQTNYYHTHPILFLYFFNVSTFLIFLKFFYYWFLFFYGVYYFISDPTFYYYLLYFMLLHR